VVRAVVGTAAIAAAAAPGATRILLRSKIPA
jgi:hypothetical protein